MKATPKQSEERAPTSALGIAVFDELQAQRPGHLDRLDGTAKKQAEELCHAFAHAVLVQATSKDAGARMDAASVARGLAETADPRTRRGVQDALSALLGAAQEAAGQLVFR